MTVRNYDVIESCGICGAELNSDKGHHHLGDWHICTECAERFAFWRSNRRIAEENTSQLCAAAI